MNKAKIQEDDLKKVAGGISEQDAVNNILDILNSIEVADRGKYDSEINSIIRYVELGLYSNAVDRIKKIVDDEGNESYKTTYKNLCHALINALDVFHFELNVD